MKEQIIRTIRTLLPLNAPYLTNEQIEQSVDIALSIPQYQNQADREQLIREIKALYNIRVGNWTAIEDESRKRPWLSSTRASIDWHFWNRYQEYLETNKGYSLATLAKLDELTDFTLDKLFNPAVSGRVDKRGMVVGQVQSGKTSNYTGLICKAADAGFKLIIVLAGSINNLRSQTQFRLDEGFLGFDTQTERAFNNANRKIGAGLININNPLVAHSLTSSLDSGDFKTAVANGLGINFDTNEPIVLVTKKNATVLNGLIQWLGSHAIVGGENRRIITQKSVLVIDDEADNASINTKLDDVTAINSRIRSLLRLFDKSAYIGYTATPFANIFIPIDTNDANLGDDLFPRDFIINIPAPSNYIGPRELFGIDAHASEEDSEDPVYPIVRRVDDFDRIFPARHSARDLPPTQLPESLHTAIKSFILTCAIRRIRGHVDRHNSMLIHVSRFVQWQHSVAELVRERLRFYKNGIEYRQANVLNEFKELFESDYLPTTEAIINTNYNYTDPEVTVYTWEEVENELHNAASKILLREVNGGARDVLDYFSLQNQGGFSVIAVGGDKLSRGLTLEGLSISYYLRVSTMYDTLMQMGRWFGYRPGYIDLCRIFLSPTLNEWFCHITLASEELREEFDYMSNVAGSTPKDYALRVRTSPGVLQISASNKIRNAVTMRLSYAGRLVETYEFPKKTEIIEHNFRHTKLFIEGLGDFQRLQVGNSYVWDNKPAEDVINFLSGYKTIDNLARASSGRVAQFIRRQLPNRELINWTIVLINKKNADNHADFVINGVKEKIGLTFRGQNNDRSNNDIYYLTKSHILSPRHEFYDLSEDEEREAMRLTAEKRIRENKDGDPLYPNAEIVRNEVRKPENALLLIYPLDPIEGFTPPFTNVPIVGYAISFPRSNYDEAVMYAVHEQLLSIFDNDQQTDDLSDDDE